MRTIFYCIFLILISTNIIAQEERFSFPDQLKCRFMPKHAKDTAVFFANKGIWHGYTLPENNDTKNYGKFGGPYCFYTNKWFASSLLNLSLSVAGQGKVDLNTANAKYLNQFPGLLMQEFEFDDYKLILKLEAVTTRVSLFQAILINTSDNVKKFSMQLEGSMFDNTSKIEQIPDGWIYKVNGLEDIIWFVRFRLDSKMELNYSDSEYEFTFKEMQTVQAKDSLKITAVVAQFFNGDLQQDVLLTNDILSTPELYIDNNKNFWNFLFGHMTTQTNIRRQMTLNAFQTIYLNLRSALPTKKYFTVLPYNETENLFVNVDEAWFTAVSLLKFDPRISYNVISFILSSINEDGALKKYLSIMPEIADKNEIIDKPMAAWTVFNVYSVTQDDDFVKMCLPFLDKYLNYWFENRDVDKNGWAENSQGIEEVALNAILFTETHSMLKMYEAVDDKEKIDYYQKQVERIAENFNLYFFQVDHNRYCDFNAETQEYTVAKNSIGYCLWSGIANQSIADVYAQEMAKDINSDEIFYRVANYDMDPAYLYLMSFGFKMFNYVQIQEAIKSIYTNSVDFDFMNNNKLFVKKYESKTVEYSTYMAAIYLLMTNYL
ncbi:MAG TPA: trehalase family glycosidase [Bacteroidales bacterium]|nr:trehalase family glycosidase [Bacteroidales bacterium]